MSSYIFPPSPNFNVSEHAFVTYRDAFNLDELNEIIRVCETLEKEDGILGDNNDSNVLAIRRSKVAWLGLTNETEWIYNRMSLATRRLNGEFYKFDLFGFDEKMQYTVYESSDEGHYTWHLDNGIGMNHSLSPRKLSLVLQLSDPRDYDGGDLELFAGSEVSVVTKERGLITAFPSFRLHRVTPVSSGVRRTLVVWACGPAFR